MTPPRAAAALLLLAWWALLPPAQKLRAVCAAAAYSGIEFVFTFLHEGEAFTSFAQFWGNLLYTPVLLDGYWWLLAPQQRGVVVQVRHRACVVLWRAGA